MNDTTQPQSPQSTSSSLPVPVNKGDVVAIDGLDAARQQKARELMAKIDLADATSVISFGVEAQSEVTTAVDQMLNGVRNKDTGPIGESLNELMIKVRGLGVDDLKPGEQRNWFERNVLRQIHPVAKFIQSYETIQSQLDGMVGRLDANRMRLVRDVTMLDKMYEATLAYFYDLEVYIAAAQAKLDETRNVVIPQLKAKADQSGDLIDAQNLRDTVARADDLERKVYDLRLTRQVTLQALPQMRLVQDVDKSLVSKIQSTILTTIPVWKSQIAMAIALWNQAEAVKTQRMVSDTTNEMLARNAELLRMGSAEARREIERGIFDVETVKKVNDELIATIKESLQIAEEGREKRAVAEQQLQVMEGDLKKALLSAEKQFAQRQIGPGSGGSR